MKKIDLPFLLVCFLAFNSSAQPSVDSLRAVVNAATNEDTSLVMAYRQLYLAHYNADQRAQMLEVAEKGLALSRKLRFTKGIDLFIYYKATALDVLGRGHEAIPLYEEGVQVAQDLGDPVVMADYFSSIGLAYNTLGDQDKALQFFFKAHDIYEREKEWESLSKMLNNIAVIYRSQDRYDRAEELYQQSFGWKKKLQDSLGMAASLQNLGVVYLHQKRYDKALESLKQGLGLFEKLGASNDVAGCHLSIGDVFYQMEEWQEARLAIERALAILHKKPSPELYPAAMFSMGMLLSRQGELLAAVPYMEQSVQRSRQYGQKENLLKSLIELSKLEDALGRHATAYQLATAALALKDSLTEEKRLSIMEEMQARFDVGQKENELKISKLELLRRTSERNWFLGGAVLLGILALSIFYAFRNRLRLSKRTAEHQYEIQRQRIVQLEQENRLTALTAMLEGQEQERTRIALDLHDSLGGLLASIKSHFNASRQPASDENGMLEKTNGMLDEAADEVRRIAHNMMPRALALTGLKGALEDLGQYVERQGLNCQLELVGLDKLCFEPAQLAMVYRIAQELTHNAIKHAEASQLLLQAIQRSGILTLIVEDDGKGFDVAAARLKEGIGLSSIESRVKFLNGDIAWDSVLGEGTTVSINVPAPVGQ